MKLFDTHAHYDSRAFDEDREAVIAALPSAGVGGFVDISADIEDMDDVLQLALTHENAWCALGVHPSELEGMDEGVLEKIRKLKGDYPEKVAAIGEIGLDYHYEPDEKEKQLQKEWFVRQLELAEQLDLPVVIHSRDAAEQTFDILKEHAGALKGAVIHCFSYSRELAEAYARLGFYIGVGGVVTFKNSRKLKEAVSALPIDRILLETDCPYLAPSPHRGERNSSLLLPLVAGEVAALKGMDVEEAAGITWENACSFYGIEN